MMIDRVCVLSEKCYNTFDGHVYCMLSKTGLSGQKYCLGRAVVNSCESLLSVVQYSMYLRGEESLDLHETKYDTPEEALNSLKEIKEWSFNQQDQLIYKSVCVAIDFVEMLLDVLNSKEERC